MPVEQWCVKVPREQGEEDRQRLLRDGLLDTSLKIRREGETLLFPVLEPIEGAVRSTFEAGAVQQVLPRHELVGGIAIMQEQDTEGAQALLASRPNLHTVLFPTSEVEGEYRTRSFEVLAGEDTTRTQVTEYGHTFEIDLTVAYFSARLSTERQRVLGLVQPGERVLDMFAGVGPFAIVLAGKARSVVACDLNPGAILLMRRNIARNRVRNVIPVLGDAGHLADLDPGKFDRIVMNLPLAAPEFLGAAFTLIRPGGTIHLYALQSNEGDFMQKIEAFHPARIEEHVVRSYSPAQWHAVYDIVTRDSDR